MKVLIKLVYCKLTAVKVALGVSPVFFSFELEY